MLMNNYKSEGEDFLGKNHSGKRKSYIVTECKNKVSASSCTTDVDDLYILRGDSL